MRPTRDPKRIHDEAEAARAVEEFMKKGGKVKQAGNGELARVETGESCNWRDQAGKRKEVLGIGQ